MSLEKKVHIKKSGGLRLDESWPFLLIFLFFSATFELFPRIATDHAPSFYVFLGVLVCFFYLLSVLIHEGGHLLAALVTKFPYEGEILSIWGGRPKTVRSLLASDPRIMAVRMSGPLANLLVGGGIYYWIPGGGFDPVKWELVRFFAKANLLLAFVNMLPVLPFDMGALVLSRFGTDDRKVYTGEEKDFPRGVIFGWILSVGGILLGGRGSLLTGFASVVIGFLLIRSCLSWRERLGFASYLERNGVDWAVAVTCACLETGTPLDLAREIFRMSGESTLPVVDSNGVLVGKMAWRELRKKPIEAWHLYSVGEMMIPLEQGDVFSVDPPEVTQRVFDLLQTQRRLVWVTSGGKLIGQMSPIRLHERYRMDRVLSDNPEKGSGRLSKTDPVDQPTNEV